MRRARENPTLNLHALRPIKIGLPLACPATGAPDIRCSAMLARSGYGATERAVVALSSFACRLLGSGILQGNEQRRESKAAPCDRIAAMKRNEAQLHTERARIAEDLEEAHERLADAAPARVPGLGFRLRVR